MSYDSSLLLPHKENKSVMDKKLREPLSSKDKFNVDNLDKLYKFFEARGLSNNFPILKSVNSTILHGEYTYEYAERDRHTIQMELREAGIQSFPEKYTPRDPKILMVMRTIPDIVGVLPGYELYRYNSCWVAFSNEHNFVSMPLDEVCALSITFFTQKTLTDWAISVIREYNERITKKQLGAYEFLYISPPK